MEAKLEGVREEEQQLPKIHVSQEIGEAVRVRKPWGSDYDNYEDYYYEQEDDKEDEVRLFPAFQHGKSIIVV